MMNPTTLSDVIRIIVQNYGEDTLRDERFTLAVFLDLAPKLTKEKDLLHRFLLCNGAERMISVKSESRSNQESCINGIVRDLEDRHFISQKAAHYVCSEVYLGLTGRTWQFVQRPAKQLDVHESVTIKSSELSSGKNLSVKVDGKEVILAIPANVKDGETLRFQKKGKHDAATGNTGDLYVTVHITVVQPKKNGIIFALAAAVILLVFAVTMLLGNGKQSAADNPKPGNTGTAGQVQTNTQTNNQTNTHVHSWKAATCTSPRICTECKKIDGEELGHSWEEATYNEAKTCTVCNATEGSPKSPSSALGILDIISSADASSVYSGDNLGVHGPEKMYDGRLDTNWTENASGNGVGEYVIFYFDDTYAVKKLQIYIGSHYSKAIYEQNCRPSVITLTFSDGSTERIRLKDSYNGQTITFDRYYYTDYVKLTIDEVYTGTTHPDAVIAELDFVAYRP